MGEAAFALLESDEATPASEHHALASEIAESNRALAELLHRSSRLHASNIQHDSLSCLVCFTER